MQEKIQNFLSAHGAGQVGFCKLEGQTPFGLSYAVSYTIPLSDAIIDSITDAPTHTYFHHYRTVNTLIDRLSLQVGLMLAQNGYRYAPVPASQSISGFEGLFSHKQAAVLAGLGSIGKSNLFLSDQYGPRVRLGTVLTDCAFDVQPVHPSCLCGSCNLCVKACPAMAITGTAWRPGIARAEMFDAQACSSYMKRSFQQIGRGAVCGICMRVCPKGQNKK